MNDFEKLARQISLRLTLLIGLLNILLIGTWIGLDKLGGFTFGLNLAAVGILVLLSSIFLGRIAANYSNQPLRMLWQAITHVSPTNQSTPPPNIDKLRIGRELITNLSHQIYQLASGVSSNQKEAPEATAAISVLDSLPLPLLALNSEDTIVLVNDAATAYFNSKDLTGKNVNSLLNLSFPTEDTLDSWLSDARKNKVTDKRQWERVREIDADNKTLHQFNLAAAYSKDHPSGIDTALVLFDQTETYAEDDQALSFIALAVHELRTPLTALRGFIEVFEEELDGKLEPELNEYLHKTKASAEQLTTFVNNILNVARAEENQLILALSEHNWETILKQAIADMTLRAGVHNKTIELKIEPNLPAVAVDPVTVMEVVYNLVDNAIKYSGEAPKKIIVSSKLTKDGFIETTIEDFGLGIASTVVPHLFDKFYRNHRTRSQVGGTGLGLYLSKEIVKAHGGNIWVRSEEGQGSTFGFTLQSYASVATELKNNDNKGITRGAYGWIKNHSLYRD
jgi:signal transduction histidine kinase